MGACTCPRDRHEKTRARQVPVDQGSASDGVKGVWLSRRLYGVQLSAAIRREAQFAKQADQLGDVCSLGVSATHAHDHSRRKLNCEAIGSREEWLGSRRKFMPRGNLGIVQVRRRRGVHRRDSHRVAVSVGSIGALEPMNRGGLAYCWHGFLQMSEAPAHEAHYGGVLTKSDYFLRWLPPHPNAKGPPSLAARSNSCCPLRGAARGGSWRTCETAHSLCDPRGVNRSGCHHVSRLNPHGSDRPPLQSCNSGLPRLCL